jgi:transcriptional regulator with XRE-family HTH domain
VTTKVTKHPRRPLSPLGLAVQKLRHESGLSQERLAALARIGRTTIAKLETGRSQTMTMESLQKIAPALGTTVTSILAMEPASAPESVRKSVSRFVSSYLLSPWALRDKPTEAEKARLRKMVPDSLTARAPVDLEPWAVHLLLMWIREWDPC